MRCPSGEMSGASYEPPPEVIRRGARRTSEFAGCSTCRLLVLAKKIASPIAVITPSEIPAIATRRERFDESAVTVSAAGGAVGISAALGSMAGFEPETVTGAMNR